METFYTARQVTSNQVYRFFETKGYTVCNVTPISNSTNWFAVLSDKKNFIIATVYTQGKEIERIEKSVL